MEQHPLPFWNIPVAELFLKLQTSSQGLTSDEARKRLISHGFNLLSPKKRSDALILLMAQFKSPIVLLLLFAAGLSFFLRDPLYDWSRMGEKNLL